MSSRNLLRNTGILAVFTGLSRVLGLVREQVFVGLFGASGSPLADAFNVAFRIPNLLRDLFAEGALSAAFVPTFAKKIEKDGDAEAWKLANCVATALILVVGGIVLLGIFAAPSVVALIAPGYADREGKAELTIRLTRVMMPFLLMVALAAVWMGMLNTRGKFGVPASASTMFNLGSILLGAGLALWLDPSLGTTAITAMAVGTLAGGFFQWAIQVPSLRKEGYRFRPRFDFKDEGFREVLRLMAPAIIGTSAVQINVMVNTRFASAIPGDGPVTWLNTAFRLMQFPIGVFGVAVGTATLPTLSRLVAQNDMEGFRGTLKQSLRLVTILALPSACGLAILAEPIIGVIYQHGRFEAADTIQTAWALRYYAIGLAAYAAIKVVVPASYALGDSRTPAFVSLFSIAVNYGMNWLFTLRFGWGHRGLAFAVSTVAIVNFALIFLSVGRKLGGYGDSGFFRDIGKIVLAAGMMSAGCRGILFLSETFFAKSFLTYLLTVGVGIGVSVLLFWGSAHFLHIREVQAVFSRVSGRFFRQS